MYASNWHWHCRQRSRINLSLLCRYTYGTSWPLLQKIGISQFRKCMSQNWTKHTLLLKYFLLNQFFASSSYEPDKGPCCVKNYRLFTLYGFLQLQWKVTATWPVQSQCCGSPKENSLKQAFWLSKKIIVRIPLNTSKPLFFCFSLHRNVPLILGCQSQQVDRCESSSYIITFGLI